MLTTIQHPSRARDPSGLRGRSPLTPTTMITQSPCCSSNFVLIRFVVASKSAFIRPFAALWRSLDPFVALGDGDGEAKVLLLLLTTPLHGDCFSSELSLRARFGFRETCRLSARVECLGVASSRRWAFESDGDAGEEMFELSSLFRGDVTLGDRGLPLGERTRLAASAGSTGGGGGTYRAWSRGHTIMDPGIMGLPLMSISHWGNRSRLHVEHTWSKIFQRRRGREWSFTHKNSRSNPFIELRRSWICEWKIRYPPLVSSRTYEWLTSFV